MLSKFNLIEIEEVTTEENNFENVYDLEVEENHSYTANGYIVHNCDTRIVAGVGIPQFSAVMACADVAHGLGAQIIADGGIKEIADFSKAFAAGCFTSETLILKSDGKKEKIADIQVGDEVYTHRLKKQKVVTKFNYKYQGSLIKINGISSTPDHKYYVIHKKYKNLVTEETLSQYAEWVKAKDLTLDYLLLKLVQS